MARYFTLRLYYHSPLALENKLALSLELFPLYHTLIHVISTIYIIYDLHDQCMTVIAGMICTVSNDTACMCGTASMADSSLTGQTLYQVWWLGKGTVT